MKDTDHITPLLCDNRDYINGFCAPAENFYQLWLNQSLPEQDRASIKHFMVLFLKIAREHAVANPQPGYYLFKVYTNKQLRLL